MKPPNWHPEDHADYDSHLQNASDAIFAVLTTASSAEQRRLALDPRPSHKQLYANLAPSGFPEYAGTYRGTVGTSLESREVDLVSQTGAAVQAL